MRRSAVMAFAGQIILSSSPSHVATPLLGSITLIPSSPSLPSPSQLFTTNTTSKSKEKTANQGSNGFAWENNNATTILELASASGSLQDTVNDTASIFREDNGLERGNLNQLKPKKSQAEKGERIKGSKKAATPAIATRKPRKKSAVTAENSEAPKQTCSSEKKAAKTKEPKKTSGVKQSKIERRRITKPGIVPVIVAKKRESALSEAKNPLKLPQNTISSAADLLQAKTTFSAGEEKGLDLVLAEAVRRRKEWTPPKNTAPKDTSLEAPNPKETARCLIDRLVHEPREPGSPALGGFENLLDDFGYADRRKSLPDGSNQCRKTNGEAVTKRRKLEVSCS